MIGAWTLFWFYLCGRFPRATQGDIAAIIGAGGVRRARLLGLKSQQNAGLRFGADGLNEIDSIDPVTGERRIRVEIINDPEVGRREHLYRKGIEALGGDPTIEGESVGSRLN